MSQAAIHPARPAVRTAWEWTPMYTVYAATLIQAQSAQPYRPLHHERGIKGNLKATSAAPEYVALKHELQRTQVPKFEDPIGINMIVLCR